MGLPTALDVHFVQHPETRSSTGCVSQMGPWTRRMPTPRRRVGKKIAKAPNSAITAAVRQGVLVEANPLGESGVKPRTYRLPGQPEVDLRELGPRSLDDVPPQELTALLADVAAEHGWEHEEALYRAVLDELGLKRLTTNVTARLNEVMPLARDAGHLS